MKRTLLVFVRALFLVIFVVAQTPALTAFSAADGSALNKSLSATAGLVGRYALTNPGPAPAEKFTVVSAENFKAKQPATSRPYKGVFGLQAAAPLPAYSFQGNLEIEPITAYNLIVDSNVLAPSSYGPNAATLGARFCNRSGSTMTNVWAYIGDYDAVPANRTPGTYPQQNPTTNANFNTDFPHLSNYAQTTAVDYGDPSRFYALEQEAGSTADQTDASRYIGTLAANQCVTQYWLVSYPRKAYINNSWVDVTGDVKPEDDLWLQYDFWATNNAGNTSYYNRYVTMRNEISAMANKIWPNGDNKVPQEYIDQIQQVLGWDTWIPGSTGTTAFPGDTIISQGIWYDMGNVGAGFDNNYDLVPDRNAWLQPIGDASAYDPGCFRLVKTYGLVIVKLNDGTEQLIPFVDQLYFENVPGNNTGAVGLVFYEYAALNGACTASLTPYQEVASGFDNEKFNADFGAGIPPIQSRDSNLIADKETDPAITNTTLGGSINYVLTFYLPDIDNTGGNTDVVTIGNPSYGTGLTYYDQVPVGVQYVACSAYYDATLAPNKYPASCPVGTLAYADMTNYGTDPVSATVMFSTDAGTTWSLSDPGNYTSSSTANQLHIKWTLSQGITSPASGAAVSGTVGFTVSVPVSYTGSNIIENTLCMKIGDSGPPAEGVSCDEKDIPLSGTAAIQGTVWADTGVGSGTLGDGSINGTEPGIADGADGDSTGVTVYLYWDNNADGDYSDASDFLYGTTTTESTATTFNYCFDGTPGNGTCTTGSGGLPETSDTGDDQSNIISTYDVVNGLLDIGGDGQITAADDATNISGVIDVIDGWIDINSDGIINGSDDGTLGGRNVINGYIDADADTNVGARWIIVVETTDGDIPTGYGPTTTTVHDDVATVANTLYGDATLPNEPSDFGFAPPLTVQKRRDTPSPVAVGALVQYTLTVKNNLPGSGGPSTACEYYAYANTVYPTTHAGAPDGGGPTNAQFQNPTASGGAPDENYAFSDLSNNTDLIGYGGFAIGYQGGNITKVESVVFVRERAEFDSDDNIYVRTWFNDTAVTGTGIGTFNGTFFSSAAGTKYTLVTDITSSRTWNWSDFNNTGTGAELQFEANKGGGSTGDIEVDAIAFRITTDGTCDPASKTLNPVPLVDEFDHNYLRFVSASMPISSGPSVIDGNSTEISWSNVGPLYPGQIKYITVTFQAVAATTGTTTTINYDESTNAYFSSGLPANSDLRSESDNQAPVDIDPNTSTQPLSGRVFDDNNTANGWATAAWTEPNGTTGYEVGDTGIGNIEVDLFGCVIASTGALGTSPGTNKTCNDVNGNDTGSWVYIGSTSTHPYAIVDGLVDVDGDGITAGDADDDGSAYGCTITNGSVSVCSNYGVFTVSGGYVDTDRDGTYNETGDDFLKGGYIFPNLWDGFYYVDVHEEFISGTQSADVNQAGVCTTCDSRSADPGTTPLTPGTFPGDLVNNTSGTTNVNFGYGVGSGTFNIGDTIFFDWDGDGNQDIGVDEGIPNVTVQLLGPDGVTVIASTTTDTSGNYLFVSYPVGNYTVRVVPSSLPTGMSQTKDPDSTTLMDNQSTFSLTATDLTRDFGYRPTGTGQLGDTVFRDMNGDGTQGGAETGISGVTVELQVDFNNDGTWVTVTTDTTDSNGNYLFTGLPAGTYRVVLDRTTNASAIPNDGFGNEYIPSNSSGDTTFTNGNPDVYFTKVLATNTSSVLTADFAFAPPASIGDTVYQDLDGDGTQDFNEPGIPGVTVTLYTFTDSNNNSKYDVAESGTLVATGSTTTTSYEIINGKMDITGDGLITTADDGSASGCTVTDGNITVCTSYLGFPVVGNSIDINRSGAIEASDDLARGFYNFNGLTPGYYAVQVTPPAGSTLTGDPSTDGFSCLDLNHPADPGEPSSQVCDHRDGQRLYNGSNYVGADFGYQIPGNFGDSVWIDADNDGSFDSGEVGIPEITVTATTTPPNGAVVNGVTYNGVTVLTLTTETDADGRYAFSGITTSTALTWTVTVNTADAQWPSASLTNTYDPDGTTNSSTTVLMDAAGAITNVGGCTTTPNGCDSETDPLRLDADFGYRFVGTTSISGTICFEVTADGVCGDNNADPSGVNTGAGESAYSGKTVNLYKLNDTNTNGLLDPGETTILIATTTTDANGDYSFTGLADGAGTYYVISIGAPVDGLNMTSTTGSVNAGGDGSQTTETEETVAPDGDTVSALQVINATTAGSTIVDRDFSFTLTGTYDFGDNPASYSVNLSHSPDGPRHMQSTNTLYFGTTPDTESNGQPSTDATGDGSDEDGVIMPLLATENTDENGGAPGHGWEDGAGILQFDIVGSGYLVGWIDWNGDGDFGDSYDSNNDGDYTDAGEWREMVISQSVTAGNNQDLAITTPNGVGLVPDGYYYARFRLFPTAPGLPNISYFGVTTNGEVEDYRFPILNGPTPVTLSHFQASSQGGSVSFEWSTAMESGNLGFNLYDGEMNRLNSALIASKSADSMNRQDYSFSAASNAGTFYIEDVSVGGQTELHGPFNAGETYGDRSSSELIDWSVTRAEANSAMRVNDSANIVVTASSAGVNLKVNKTGLYRVTFEMLRDAGFDFSNATTRDLKLTSNGVNVPIYVYVRGTRFSTGSYFEFYGQALDNLYTNTNVYTLQFSKGARASSSAAAYNRLVTPPASFTETMTVNNQKEYATYALGNDPWYDTYMFANSPQNWDTSFTVTNLANATAPATMKLTLWGLTQWPAANDHHVLVSINGVQVGDLSFDGFAEGVFNIDIPANTLRDGANTLRLTLPNDRGLDYDVVTFDQFTLTYQRSFKAVNGSLSFTASGKNIQVTDLLSRNVVVYRVDAGTLVRITNVSVQASGSTYKVNFAGTNQAASYVVSEVTALNAPTFEAARQTTGLDTPARYLIISHPNFLGGLGDLVAARRAQGFTVNTVDVRDIYARYSGGTFSPQAIKDYIAHAEKNLGTQYVLIVGGDSADYRNYVSTSVSFVPSMYTKTGTYDSFVPSDALFADTDGDKAPEVAIGRFPVRTTGELATMIQKTLAYGNRSGDYATSAVFVADRFDDTGSYKNHAMTMSTNLPTSWTKENIFLDDMSVSAANTALLAAMNRGTALVIFTGHSAPGQWTFPAVFNTAQAASLSNAGKPFVAIQWGCWDNYYVDPRYNHLTQSLLLSGDRGAAATLGVVTRGDTRSEEALSQVLIPRLFTPGMTLGQAIQLAKIDMANSDPTMVDMLFGFTLMGDPALMVQP